MACASFLSGGIMSNPTTAIGFSPTIPAPPTGDQNTIAQTDNGEPLQKISFYPQRAIGSLYGTVKQIVSTVGVTIVTGSSPTTGLKGTMQVPYAGTIIGWTILADVSVSASVDIWKVASSAPPSVPAIPTSGNKISASAPVSLSTAQAAAVAAAGVSTWTTAVAAWDVFGFNLTSVSSVARLTIELQILRS
jgi:hypothetical protein